MADLVHTKPAQPWDPLQAETAEEYRAFYSWLLASPRPSPADVNPNLSPSWRERAHAWDLQCAVHAGTGGTQGPKALAEMVLWGYLQIAAQETVKLVRASQLGERVMTARDLREVPLLIAELTKLAPPADTGGLDLAQATPEERALLLKALPVLERIRRKK